MKLFRLWQITWLAFIGVFLTATLTGCVHLPTLHQELEAPASSVTAGPTNIKNTVAGVSTVKEAAHREAILFWIIGILLLLGGAALLYFQFYLPGLKVIAAGVVLPVVGTIWSEHYAIIISASLVGLAIWYALTHQAAVSAIVGELGEDGDLALASIKSAVQKLTAAQTAPVTTNPQPSTK